MIEGRLHETQKAMVTQSEIGRDYLDLRVVLDTGEKVNLAMSVKVMKSMGAMMAVVAKCIESRNLKRN